MAGAAVVLGISRRTLVDILKTLPHFEPRGNRKVFYPEHIEALREGITRCLGSKQRGETASFTPLAPLQGSVFERALALVTLSSPRNSAPSTRQGSGSVVSMAKRRSARSR